MDTKNFYDNPAAHGFTFIDELYSGGYDWKVVAAYKRNSDAATFWVAASGCSCYGVTDLVRTPEDLTPLRKHEEEFFNACVESHYYWSLAEGHEFYSKIMLLSR